VGAPCIISLAAIGLSGCGKLGNLDRPGPMFGKAGQANTPRQQQQDPNRPVQTIDPRDENTTPAPSRTVPIPGQSPDPFGARPPGALPDVYSNPPR
jgi:hypothetical protein